jgi:tRNA A-37 threonylcarbamoyl transferase component Bud32
MRRHARMLIAAGWEPWLREHGLGSLEAVYRCELGGVIKRSGSVEVRSLQLGLSPNARIVFIKKYWAGHPSQLWSGMFRGVLLGRSKARREYENLNRLRAWGLDAPAPVAFGEERRAGWLLRSFLISESVSDPQPLDVFIRERLPATVAGQPHALRQELIEQLAGFTRRLHEHAFVHHDYFWRNILLSGGDLKRFFLIDAHKGRRWFPWEERRARAKDLAALDAPAPHFFRRTERLRFFLLYRGRRSLAPEDKALLRLTLRLAAPLRERQLRRVRGIGRTASG